MFDAFLFNGYSAPICKIDSKNIAIILKNGTTSLKKLSKNKGYKVTNVKEDFALDTSKDYFIDVYFRNPVDRYFSALDTVRDIYKLPKGTPTIDEVPKSKLNNGFFIDDHFYPQYWYMISAYIESWNSDKVYFRFHDFDKITEILGTVRENANPNKNFKSASNRVAVKQRYVYDSAIYHHLLGETLNFPELLDFFSEVTDGYPRIADFISKTSPKNHDLDTQKKVDHYNQALDEISQIAKKFKKY